MAFTSHTYKLRSSGPFPTSGGAFIVHTFKAEKSEVSTYEALTSLKNSENMAGLGGEYVSISYNANTFTLNSSLAFSGVEIKKPEYIDEDSIPGV